MPPYNYCTNIPKYPYNAAHKFIKQVSKSGVDVFSILDSLKYIENLSIGVDAISRIGGFVEGTLSYRGGVSDPNKDKYDLEYYINLTRDIADMGVQYIFVSDMANLLNTRATAILVLVFKEELPGMHPHIHNHDITGKGSLPSSRP